jgi:hypothetical protein
VRFPEGAASYQLENGLAAKLGQFRLNCYPAIVK